MGHQKLSGLAAVRVPDIPMLAFEDAAVKFVIYQIGNLATPRRVASTQVGSGTGNYIADPEASPTLDGSGIPTEFLYSFVGAGSGLVNSVQLVAWDDSSNDVVITSPNATSGNGQSISMQPSWHPNGTQLVYRTTEFEGPSDPTVTFKIKRIDRDGTNDTLLYDPADNNFRVYNPMYSYDGTKIAWVEQEDFNPTPITVGTKRRLKVMDADGSNVLTLAGPLYPQSIFDSCSWANNSLTIAYVDTDGATATDDWNWKRIESDGTGGLTIYTIDRAGRTFSQIDPTTIKWSWLQDDSALVTTLLDTGTGDHTMVLLDAFGGGPTSLGITDDAYGTPDARPVDIRGRIYFPNGTLLNVTEVDSVTEAGADQRIDWNGTVDFPDVYFEGFKGDTITS